MSEHDDELIEQLKKDGQWNAFRLASAFKRPFCISDENYMYIERAAYASDLIVLKAEITAEILALDTTKDIKFLTEYFDSMSSQPFKDLLSQTKQENEIVSNIMEVLERRNVSVLPAERDELIFEVGRLIGESLDTLIKLANEGRRIEDLKLMSNLTRYDKLRQAIYQYKKSLKNSKKTDGK